MDPVVFAKIEEVVLKQTVTIDKLEKELTQAKRTLGNYKSLHKDLTDLQKQVKDLKPKKDK